MAGHGDPRYDMEGDFGRFERCYTRKTPSDEETQPLRLMMCSGRGDPAPTMGCVWRAGKPNPYDVNGVAGGETECMMTGRKPNPYDVGRGTGSNEPYRMIRQYLWVIVS